MEALGGWGRRRRLLVSVLLAIGGLVGAAAPVASAAVIPVTTTAEISDGNCTLRAAIDAANHDEAVGSCPAGSGSDRIAITATGDIALQSALPQITDDVTIDGPGAEELTVMRDSGGAYRIFHAAFSDVNIEGLTISNGAVHASGALEGDKGGGGVLNDGGRLRLDGVVVEGNTVTTEATGPPPEGFEFAHAFGGGVHSTSTGELEVVDSRIEDNTVSVNATGADRFAIPLGGGIHVQGKFKMARSTVTGNETLANAEFIAEGSGGVSVAAAPDVEVSITASTISDNLVELTSTTKFVSPSGAGLHVTGYHPVTLDRVTVTDNTLAGSGPEGVNGRGGGIALVSVTEAELKGSTVAENEANYMGANVYFNSQDALEFENTIISDPIGALNCEAANGTFDSLGHNLEFGGASSCEFDAGTDITGADPLLDEPADNGGAVETMAVPPTSPAVDAGVAAGADRDARGARRPVQVDSVPNGPGSDGSDIGAFEAQPAVPDPMAMDFGPHLTGGEPTAEAITVTNRWNSGVTLGTATITGPEGSAFALGSDDCSGETLSEGETCTLEVSFDAGEIGDKEATLTLEDFVTDEGMRVALAGSAVAPETAISPGQLNFGSQPTGSPSAPRTATVTNETVVPVEIAGVELGGQAPGAFSILADDCTGSTLPSGETCEVSMRFLANTGTPGAKQATLAVDANGDAPSEAALRGTEIRPTPPPDTTPPTVKIHSIKAKRAKGKGRKAKGKATARFSGTDDSSAALSFRCRVDKGRDKPCTSPLKLKKLKPGKHTLRVIAKDEAGNESAPAQRAFKVKKPKKKR